MKTDEELLKDLREATAGLLFMSESDHPLEVIAWEGGEPVTHVRLRREAGKGEDAPVAELTAAQLFRAAASEPDWKGAAELATARRYQSLVRLLEENLTDLAAYRVGEIDITAYVLGRSAEGNWLGVKTRMVET
jgi:hypothetical protein